MVQKCSYFKTLEVFFKEPLGIHFIKSISKKIGMAPTSVRKNIQELLKENLIAVKKSKPFDGYVSNRDNKEFIFLKRAYNLYSLNELTDFLVESYYPTLIILFGSYSFGEDVEGSDIDLVVVSKTKKELDLTKFENSLKREIQIFVIKDFKDFNKFNIGVKQNLKNGMVLTGRY